jgi:hypothetical protein
MQRVDSLVKEAIEYAAEQAQQGKDADQITNEVLGEKA